MRTPLTIVSRHDDGDTALAGADEVAARLHREHSAALLAYTTRLTHGDHQWAEDVVQETLLRAWLNRIETSESGRSVRPWLYRVARNLVIDGHRRRALRPVEMGDELLQHIGEPDQIDRMLLSVTLLGALRTLSAEHQEVIRELYLRGTCVEETAARLRIPRGTVRSRTFYALRALRHAMEERGVTRVAAA